MYLKYIQGRSTECGHICVVLIKGFHSKSGKDLQPLEKIAKICDACGIREKVSDEQLVIIMKEVSK